MPSNNPLYYSLYQASLRNTFVWKKHENFGYPTHFHSALEIYFILEGEMEAEINGTNYRILAGDIAIINPFEIHTYLQTNKEEIKTNVAVLIVGEIFLSDFLTEHKGFVLPAHLTDKEFNQQVLAVFDGVPSSFTDNTTLSFLAKKAYVNLILDKLITHYGLIKEQKTNKEIANIVRYIYENYTQELTLDSLSAQFNYSRSTISRLLVKHLKTDLRCFVNNLRVEQANAFINDPKYNKSSIIEIASWCGFDNSATFYRAYKRRYGHNPRRQDNISL